MGGWGLVVVMVMVGLAGSVGGFCGCCGFRLSGKEWMAFLYFACSFAFFVFSGVGEKGLACRGFLRIFLFKIPRPRFSNDGELEIFDLILANAVIRHPFSHFLCSRSNTQTSLLTSVCWPIPNSWLHPPYSVWPLSVNFSSFSLFTGMGFPPIRGHDHATSGRRQVRTKKETALDSADGAPTPPGAILETESTAPA